MPNEVLVRSEDAPTSPSAYNLQDQDPIAEDIRFDREKPIDGIFWCHIAAAKNSIRFLNQKQYYSYMRC